MNNRREFNMYFMKSGDRHFIAFGQDVLQAAREICDKYGIEENSLSVGKKTSIGQPSAFEYDVSCSTFTIKEPNDIN